MAPNTKKIIQISIVTKLRTGINNAKGLSATNKAAL